MKGKNPFSASYYIKENIMRVGISVFMMLLATMMFFAGNFIQSATASFDEEFDNSDQLVLTNLQGTDEDFKDWKAFCEKMSGDSKVECVQASALGFSGMEHSTVMGLKMGGNSYVFQSKEDMEKVFSYLGIEGDLSKCKQNSIVLDEKFAKNLGVKVGDVIDHSFNSNIDGTYTVDAIVKGGGYCTYYLYEDKGTLGRMYIYSDTLNGQELYDYVNQQAKDYNVAVQQSERDSIAGQLNIFLIIFMMVDLLIAVVLAITINSVMTGQYLKRTYEFGIYRAIGISKRKIMGKVGREILLTNSIANVIGLAVVLLTAYLLNELVYEKQGMDLLYCTKTGIAGFLLCEVLIVVPLIISKARMMCKADVTQF